jgi:hypothetical protein
MGIIRRLLMLSVALAASTEAWSETAPQPLFESHQVLSLAMAVDFDQLCRPSVTPECGYTPTVLVVNDASGAQMSIPVEIRRRDGWRAQYTNCQVPTLFMRFPGETEGTPFAGQNELALTSHCGKGIPARGPGSRALPDQFESYVINEYLGYRLYNLVTDFSLRVRLVRIRYSDPANPRRGFTRDAFFSEHFDSMALRLGAELQPERGFDPASMDLAAADELALFQFMIGNTDWSIERQENIVLLRFPGGRQVPVLFDLDQSGLVNAHYARPPPGLPIRTVKERYFQGYCHPGTDWDALFDRFRALREDIVSMLVQTPGYGRGERRIASVYLDSFFAILNSERKRQQVIVSACQPWPPVGGDSVSFLSPDTSLLPPP